MFIEVAAVLKQPGRLCAVGVCCGCVTTHAITDLITPHRHYLFGSTVDHKDPSTAPALCEAGGAAQTELRRGLAGHKVK